jgi:uncharacterized damage-inducible protein DinB
LADLSDLIQDVERARRRYIDSVIELSPEQAQFTPSPSVWSAVENTEHIVRAEWGGINAMWNAAEGADTGDPAWTGDTPHRGKSIEQIVSETWRAKEQVPPVAAPTWGGALAFWIAALQANESLLQSLARTLDRHDLEGIHYPHPLSGPLDMRQRLEFLRFHLDRHRGQVEELKRHAGFPTRRDASRIATSG